MTEEELQQLFRLLHRPINWDPAPPWLKLTKEQIARYNEIQVALNTKMATIEEQKVKELAKIAGIRIR